MTFVGFIASIVAYLLGSLSFAVIVSYFMSMDDPRNYGSGNPGATNVLRSGNKLAAILTLLGDGLKGFFAVLLTLKLAPILSLTVLDIAAGAIAVLIGHMWPIFFHFKGGKGVATAVGVLFALSWPTAVACLLVWILVALGFKMSSAAALTAASLSPIFAFFFMHNMLLVAATCVIALLIIIRHKSNIQNILHGKEGKLNTPPPPEQPPT